MSNQHLFSGDASDVISSPAFKKYRGKVRTAIFSPPYYGKRVYGVDDEIGLKKNGSRSYLGYLVNLIHYLAYDVLTPDGTIWVNIKDSIEDGVYLGLPEELAHILRNLSKPVYKTGCAAWVCSNMGPSSDTRRFTEKWEPFYSFSRSKDYYFNLDPTREKPKYPEKRKTREVLLSGKGNVSGNPGRFLAANPKGKNPGNAAVFWEAFEPSDLWCHPKANNHVSANSATYPVELLRKPILACSNEGDYVLDCFCGEGSTLVQAEWLGRIPIGIDASPEAVVRTGHRITETAKLKAAYRKMSNADQKLFDEIKL